jgi:hypothetical protein
MKLIDASTIKDIYLDRYTNIYMALVELQELANKDAPAFNFREKITNTLKSHGLRINKLKSAIFFDGFLKNIEVYDLEIISIDFSQTFKELDEEKKRIFDEGEKYSSESTKLKRLLAHFKNKYIHRKLKINIDPIAVTHLIVEFLENPNNINLLFNRNDYIARTRSIVEHEIRTRNNAPRAIDHRVVEMVVVKIRQLFDDYDREFAIFNYTVSRLTKSHAHQQAIELLYTAYFTSEKNKLEVELNKWKNEKDHFKDYFTRQVAPNRNAQINNAEQYLRLIGNMLKIKVTDEAERLLASARFVGFEEKINRLKLQKRCDLYFLNDPDDNKLLKYVLEPTETILEMFKND